MPLLTIVVPTRNRTHYCIALMRFLRRSGLVHPILVADSSDSAEAETLRPACAGLAEYRYFSPAVPVTQKFLSVVRSLQTPFVVMVPDDDITFPHAIETSLAYLRNNSDYAAAYGYVLEFGIHGKNFDIHRVFFFTPSINEDEPLQRLYHLIHRYQPFYWAVFRTEVLCAAVEASLRMNVITFQEVITMAYSALRGKIARLPLIFSMRGMEESLSSLAETHPFYLFLTSSEKFMQNYLTYRNDLAALIRGECGSSLRPGPAWLSLTEGSIQVAAETKLEHVLDLIHAAWFRRELDEGMLNYTAQRLIGLPLPPVKIAPQRYSWDEPREGDAVHTSRRRQYVWRREVLTAEPREEIQIGAEEIVRIEEQLDHYELTECDD